MKYKEIIIVIYFATSIPFFVFYLYNWEITIFSIFGSILASLVLPILIITSYFIEM